MEYWLIVFDLLFSILGLLICLVILLDCKLNDGNIIKVSSCCLIGIAWMISIFSIIDDMDCSTIFSVIGKGMMVTGIYLWLHNLVHNHAIHICGYRGCRVRR